MKFVCFDSILETKSLLYNGGYILDNNGTPCCDGDKVKFNWDNIEYIGTLKWAIDIKCFEIIVNDSNSTLRFCYTKFPKMFEKLGQ